MTKQLDHASVWFAIDQLASRNRLSPSALAKRSGLDPTTFNKSKRVGGNGKRRWPTMESVSKILKATDSGFDDFAGLISGRLPGRVTVPLPLLPLRGKDSSRFFDPMGNRVGDDWEAYDLPASVEPDMVAIELCDDRMAPVFERGDVLVVSMEAAVRRGDRVVTMTDDGYIAGYRLKKRTAQAIELTGLADGRDAVKLPVGRVIWIARIAAVWT